MTDHQGLPVAGYVPQSDDKVGRVNAHKELEERCLRACEGAKNSGADPRNVALAITGLQEAFMWLNRAVFQPHHATNPKYKAKEHKAKERKGTRRLQAVS